MITINEFILNVYKDFKKFVDSNQSLCQLKALNYSQGNIPDYSDIHVQQFYLLRFAYSYAFEYKVMFDHLLEKENYSSIHISSIGCGNMIDYWSLVKSLEKIGNTQCKICYQGFDLIDWSYKFTSRPQDSISFNKGEVSETLKKYNSLSSNIYIFPKSISEFTDSDLNSICEIFKSVPFNSRKIHIMISLRSDKNNRERDMQRSRKIFDAMLSKGYKSSENPDAYNYLTEYDKGISGLDRTFSYPNEVYDFISGLDKTCKKGVKNAEGCNENCTSILTRKPALRARNIEFQIFTFER